MECTFSICDASFNELDEEANLFEYVRKKLSKTLTSFDNVNDNDSSGGGFRLSQVSHLTKVSKKKVGEKESYCFTGHSQLSKKLNLIFLFSFISIFPFSNVLLRLFFTARIQSGFLCIGTDFLLF